jgi:hypothetical protein
MKGIASVLCNSKHEKYPSNSVNPLCLITEYLNEGIGFLAGFGMTMYYPYKFQNIFNGTQCISNVPYKGVIHVHQIFFAISNTLLIV